MALGSSILLLAALCASAAEERPNVVLFMADDIGVECFGCYGGTSYSTPNIDSLAASGMRFTAAHSTPLCTPTRVRLMTGRDSIRNYQTFGILDPNEQTFAHFARNAGYCTAAAGKWQLYGTPVAGPLAGKGTLPKDAGFDHWCLWQVRFMGGRYASPKLEFDGELRTFGADRYGPWVVRDWALDFLDREHESPFLLYYPMLLPHEPYFPTPDSDPAVPRSPQQNFSDMVRCMDGIVGSVLAKLEERGLSERTLVLFTSDNGTGRAIISHQGDLDLPGGKGLTYTLGTHVPLLARWPGVISPGTREDGLIDFCDFVPTLAELCGFELPPENQEDGISFAAQLRGETPDRRREWIHLYYNAHPGLRSESHSVQTPHYKLYADGRLFDLDHDPYEQQAIVAEDDTDTHRAARAQLQELLDSWPRTGLKLVQSESTDDG